MAGIMARADADPWIELDLSMAQCKTLLLLCQQGALTIGAVADGLGVGRPAASNLVDRLVQHGLAARADDTADRRRTVATLTPAGQELVARLQQIRFAVLRQYLDRLSDPDLSALVQGIEALANAVLADRPQEVSIHAD